MNTLTKATYLLINAIGTTTGRALGYDVFAQPVESEEATVPFFKIEQGWTPRDRVVIVGPWHAIMSKTAAKQPGEFGTRYSE